MIWQDAVIAFMIAAFTVSLVPMVLDKYTPPYSTSVMMVTGGTILAMVNVTLGLWITFVVQILSSTLWAILIYQRWTENEL